MHYFKKVTKKDHKLIAAEYQIYDQYRIKTLLEIMLMREKKKRSMRNFTKPYKSK